MFKLRLSAKYAVAIGMVYRHLARYAHHFDESSAINWRRRRLLCIVLIVALSARRHILARGTDAFNTSFIHGEKWRPAIFLKIYMPR